MRLLCVILTENFAKNTNQHKRNLSIATIVPYGLYLQFRLIEYSGMNTVRIKNRRRPPFFFTNLCNKRLVSFSKHI